MISLILSFAVLIAGYLIYGRVVEGVFAPDERKTPAYTRNDGVDFMPMPTWKAFLVQLLNIAGTGPIFGALMGACFGPVVFLWIIFGAVLTQLDFNVLWRYFSWSNQTLAMISLWVATAYLLKTCKNKLASLITALPATFMSAVSLTYISMASEGFGLSAGIGYPIGIVFAAALFAVYLTVGKKLSAKEI